MKKLYGGLCIAITLLTIAAHLVGFQPDVSAEVREVNTNDNAVVEQDWATDEEEKEMASSLEIVWMDGCAPCRRLKVVATVLIFDGYDIELVNRYDGTRGSTRFPSLYYLDENRNVIRKETGFKTAEHIMEYLSK